LDIPKISRFDKKKSLYTRKDLAYCPLLSHENSKSNHNDEKHVVLYETGRKVHGKLRLSRRMLFDHMTGKYLKVLQQLINQLENEKSHYGA